MSAHTPGPWIVVHELRDSDEAVADLVNQTWVIPERGSRLGDCYADARLIAAAPGLLEALQDMVSDHPTQSAATLQFARAAIKKATEA
jgi:hypothetical protein